MNDFLSGKLKKAITFSFDDGVVQDIKMIELMAKYGIKATFNINSQLLGQGGILSLHQNRVCHYKILPQDVRQVYQGHEVASHTLVHPDLRNLSDEDVIYQVEQDRLNLSELAGYEVVGMAYPGGHHDSRVAKLIREKTGIRYCRTIDHVRSFDVQENLYQFNPTASHLEFDITLDLAEKFLALKPEKPQIFYIWGHAYEQDIGNDRWLKLEEFFRLISGHSDIFYGTNREVLLQDSES